MRIRLQALVSIREIPVTRQTNALQGLPTLCFLWVDRDSPIRGRNLFIESVSSRRKASGKRLLDLPPEEDVIPVDHILYDLVESVTLMVVGISCVSKQERQELPMCSRPFAYGGPS